ncbi:hypothetical protein DICVIV_06912 [Dictyocaulus viviparus]|uniref:Uncharacterized protein n=1 Tax=Dictyocaulus viviparus TaxID=29172 RepID=A0A0D8XR76_DICVI|nr:hypothetical protein DICVIV_06912 [Dictyocaulus viviparus]
MRLDLFCRFLVRRICSSNKLMMLIKHSRDVFTSQTNQYVRDLVTTFVDLDSTIFCSCPLYDCSIKD